MTTHVRIENADTSNFKVVVQTWDKTSEGDVMVNEEVLGHPTAMTNPHLYLTSTRYLIVKEQSSQ